MKSFFFFSCTFLLLSCADKAETGHNKTVLRDAVFPDYQVWAEEGRDVTVRLQFHDVDADGYAIALPPPATVLLDGNALAADSTRFAGIYYEVSKPVDQFRGPHEIIYVDENKKKHQQMFSVEPFTLAQELPETMKKEPFSVELKNFPLEPTPIRLVMVDAALETVDVNEELVIEGGKIQIAGSYLDNLTKGPITLEIYREEEKPLPGNGRFSMTYALRREFSFVQ